MTKINLRHYYPHYKSDKYIDVSDEIAALFLELKLHDAAFYLRTYRNKAYFSLNRGDGIENSILLTVLSPQDIYEWAQTKKQLYSAIASLPDKQAKRIYAHYFLDMGKAEIARIEGITEHAVKDAIRRGLQNMAKFLNEKS